MFFYESDLSDTSSSTMTFVKTHTFYSGFFVYKNIGECFVDGRNVFVSNYKIWGFNLDTDGLADTITEYIGLTSWSKKKGIPAFTNPSGFILLTDPQIEITPGVYNDPSLLRFVVGDFSAGSTVLLDNLPISRVIAKENSQMMILTTSYFSSQPSASQQLYTQAYDYTQPLSSPLRNYLNEYQTDPIEKSKVIASSIDTEDFYVSLTPIYRMSVKKWSDDSVIFTKLFTNVVPYFSNGGQGIHYILHASGTSKFVISNSVIVTVIDYINPALDELIYEIPSLYNSHFYRFSLLPGKRIIFNANPPQDHSNIFYLPGIPCSDPQASSCDQAIASKSSTCLGGGVVNPSTETCVCPNAPGLPVTGQFFDTALSNCESCVSGCSGCSGAGAGDCESCPPSSMFDGTKCVCIGALWLDMSGGGLGICQACDSKCSFCVGPTNGECSNCVAPYILDSGSCNDPPDPPIEPPIDPPSETTPNTFHSYTNDEYEVLMNLRLRNSIEGNLISGIVLVDYRKTELDAPETCTPNNPKKYTDLNDGLCKNCDLRCFECSGPTHGDCIKCMPGWYMKDGFCEDCSLIPTGNESEPRCKNNVQMRILNRRLLASTFNATVELIPGWFSYIQTYDIGTVGSEQWRKLENQFLLRILARVELTFVDEKLNTNSMANGLIDFESNQDQSILRHLTEGKAGYTTFKSFYKNIESIDESLDQHPFDSQPYIGVALPITSESNLLYIKRDFTMETVLYTEAEEHELQKKLRESQELRRSFTSVIGGTAAFLTGVNPLLVAPMLKYFQIIEVLSNLGKVNIEFKSNLNILFSILEDLKLPPVKFLRKLGPIQSGDPMIVDNNSFNSDSNMGRLLAEVDEEDVIYIKKYDNGIEKHYTKYTHAYYKYRRGGRGKMGTSNEDIFLFTGQQFIFSILFGVFWIAIQVSKLVKKNETKVFKIIAYIFRILFSLLIFDYQIVAVAEIAIHDYSKEQPMAYKMSYIWSGLIFFIIIFEIVQAYMTFSKKQEKKYKKHTIQEINSWTEKSPLISYDQELYYNEMTEGLSDREKTRGNTIILDSIVHFLLLQIIIATLQLTPVFQVTLIMVIELCYMMRLVSYFRAVKRKTKIPKKRGVRRNQVQFTKLSNQGDQTGRSGVQSPRQNSQENSTTQLSKFKKARRSRREDKIFQNVWMKLAFLLQQISIFVIVVVIFISMTKRKESGFFKTTTFLVMEMTLICGVITAILTQVILIIITLIGYFKKLVNYCRNRKKRVKVEPKGNSKSKEKAEIRQMIKASIKIKHKIPNGNVTPTNVQMRSKLNPKNKKTQKHNELMTPDAARYNQQIRQSRLNIAQSVTTKNRQGAPFTFNKLKRRSNHTSKKKEKKYVAKASLNPKN